MPELDEREKLARVIRQWNDNRLDLFEISQPDENLEFHGVMRFYLEDDVEGNVATKCLRVCSSSSTLELTGTLSEKFRPDMKTLSSGFALYEIHADKVRKMDTDERPLLVQLSWTAGGREGRFVLKRDQDGAKENDQEKDKGGVIQNFKRSLSRKEKNKEKRKNKGSEDEAGSDEKALIHSSTCTSTNETSRKQAQIDQGSPCSEVPGPPELPMGIKLLENSEERFLSAVLHYTNSSTVHFKLSPAYVLYAAGRSALRTHAATRIINKSVAAADRVIQRQRSIAGALAFWMANSSELLNFLKRDRDLSPLTQQSQLDLSNLVHKAYKLLLQCLQNELRAHLPTFLIDPEQYGPLPVGIEMVLNTLMNAMSLLRRCRVNPALSIQLFSQLFHFTSAWLFNQLMSSEADSRGLRCHYWGAMLRQRLAAIEDWAERQGLELAADCHLGHIVQATTLLTMNKYCMKDAKDIQNTCFKLNSLQLRTLLAGYLCASDEPQIPHDLIDAVVAAANASADSLIQSEGREIQLEESQDLSLPFLLPEEGYSCRTVKGIPPGFREFLEPICQKGLCFLTFGGNSKGSWTAHLDQPWPAQESLARHKVPEVVTVSLNKPLNSGMGVSIVAAKGAGQGSLGIYIKSIVKGGPAEMNGNLAAGDQLLSVDGRSLVGLNQERAAAIMTQTGPVVTLRVEKFGASYRGLASLLNQQISGEESPTRPGRVVHTVPSVDPGTADYPGGLSKRKKGQTMLRNRQLYRSNPNMITEFDNGSDAAVHGTRRTVSAVSTGNLCGDTFHREYLTLPNPKSNKDKSQSSHQTFQEPTRSSTVQYANKGTLVRQALSQENLCSDTHEDFGQQKDQQTKPNHIRPSVSADDILVEGCPNTKHQRSGRASGAGVWRTPFSQHPTPTPSVQPVRIDIPVTRAAKSPTNPPLMTFQNPTSQILTAKEIARSLHNPACPLPAIRKLPQMSLSSQQSRLTARKNPVANTATKHVSFEEPRPKREQTSGPQPNRDGLQLSDPRRRDAQEKVEQRRAIHTVALLEQEVQKLQAKAKRSAEEDDRLRRLSLEWRFQRRLEEIQRRGGGDDEEGDEALEMMLAIHQLGDGAQIGKSFSTNESTVGKELPKQQRSHFVRDESSAKTDQRFGKVSQQVTKAAPKLTQEKIQVNEDPETLTFKERQSLFSLVPSASKG